MRALTLSLLFVRPNSVILEIETSPALNAGVKVQALRTAVSQITLLNQIKKVREELDKLEAML